MSILNKKIGQLFAGLAVAASIGMAAAPVKADTIQLGFILDGSGSIGSGNWNIIRSGLANAIGLIPLNDGNTYEISVVQFGNTVSTPVSNYVITDAASRTALANTVAAIAFQNGSATNYTLAFNTMTSVLSNTIQGADKTYVNFATDGAHNTGGNPTAAFQAMIDAGVDNVSVEGIAVTSTLKTTLMNDYCYPGPCIDLGVSAHNFPNQGFYIGVSNAQGYADAIGNKMLIVTGQDVPAPQVLSLLGLGLLGMAVVRRRKEA